MKRQDEVTAAMARNDAMDIVLKKAAQLESLLAVLAHASHIEELPPNHRETVCWLGAEMASTIYTSAAGATGR